MQQPTVSPNLGQQYLKSNNVHFYIQDALRFVARLPEPQQLAALSEYWCSVIHGEHVIGRDFKYVTGVCNVELSLDAANI
jgi:hypothetical protein